MIAISSKQLSELSEHGLNHFILVFIFLFLQVIFQNPITHLTLRGIDHFY